MLLRSAVGIGRLQVLWYINSSLLFLGKEAWCRAIKEKLASHCNNKMLKAVLWLYTV